MTTYRPAELEAIEPGARVRITEHRGAEGARAAHDVVYEGTVSAIRGDVAEFNEGGGAFVTPYGNINAVRLEIAVDPLEQLLAGIDEIEMEEDFSIVDAIEAAKARGLATAVAYLGLLETYLKDVR